MKKRLLFCFLIFSVFITGSFSYLFANDYDCEQDFIKNLEPTEISEVDDECILIIESDIQKAEVYINGIYQGKTKLIVKNLLPGEYFIEIRKKDYISPKYFLSAKKGYSLTYKIDKEILEKN